MIELRVLGTLELRDRSRDCEIASVTAQPKRVALLCYLALEAPRTGIRRERLCQLFWPESPEERARNSLNQAVFQLRRSLGEGVLVSTPEEVALEAGALWCDAAAFDAALAEDDHRRALSLYGGDLLPEFSLEGCGEFEHWLDRERERLRRRAIAAALLRAEEEEGRGNVVGAAELLRQGAGWAPYDEAVVGRLVSLLARLGDDSGAWDAFERYRRALESLGLDPSAELEERIAEARRIHAAPAEAVPDREQGGENASSRATHPPRVPLPSRRLRWSPVAAVALAALVALGFGWSRWGRVPRAGSAETPLDERRVLVAAFENHTGDAALDPLGYMAADWIAQGLARSGMVRVVPFSTVVQETPHLTADGAAPEVAHPFANRQFARRIGAGLLIAGGYYRTGDSIVFQAQIIDVASGEILRGLGEARGSLDLPTTAVEGLQGRSLGALATLLDERLESWPDPEGQPSSLEAYRLFSAGMSDFIRAMNFHRTQEGARLYASAAERFVSATKLDSAFVTPLLWSAYAYRNAGDTAAARKVVGDLEGRPLSEWGRAVVAHLKSAVAGDLEGQYDAARELAILSPDSEWLLKLAHAAYQTGRHRQAIEALLRMDPESGWVKGWRGYWHLRAELRHALGEPAAVLEDVRQGLARHPEDRWLKTQELWALAALGRDAEILERVEPRLAGGGAEALWQLNTVLEELHGHGRKAALATVLRRATPHARAIALRDTGHLARGEYAYFLDLAGSDSEAAEIYRSLVAERPEAGEYRIRLAILDLRRGDGRGADQVLRWMETLEGETLARAAPPGHQQYWGSAEGWLTLMRAALLAQMGQVEAALGELRAAPTRGLAHVPLHVHDLPDLAPVRRHPSYPEVFGGVRE